MAKNCSFDIVSEVNMAEVLNAVNQAVTEIRQRYDFMGSKSEIKLEEKENQLVLVSDDEFKLDGKSFTYYSIAYGLSFPMWERPNFTLPDNFLSKDTKNLDVSKSLDTLFHNTGIPYNEDYNI